MTREVQRRKGKMLKDKILGVSHLRGEQEETKGTKDQRIRIASKKHCQKSQGRSVSKSSW